MPVRIYHRPLVDRVLYANDESGYIPAFVVPGSRDENAGLHDSALLGHGCERSRHQLSCPGSLMTVSATSSVSDAISPDRTNSVWSCGGLLRCAELRPGIGEPAPLLEHIAATISGLDLVGHGMCQCHLGDLGWEIGPLGRPVTKG